MFNPLAKRIGNVMDESVAKNQARKKTQVTGKPPPASKGIQGPSKDPAIMAATEAARKRSEAYLAAKAAENVVPKITRK